MPNLSAISVFSYPKVNLALDILRRDPSGYHEIQTVYHQLSEPFDELIFQSAPDGILEVKCDNPNVPTDHTNTALKAAELLKRHLKIKKGARIFIKKRIPLMSGLGGGASNAVAALKGLAKLWGISDENLLRRIADQIGMDCGFFFINKLDLAPAGNPRDPASAAVSRSRRALAGGTALGTHFGEKITPLPPIPPGIKIKIIDTGVEISSHDAYSWIDLRVCGKNQHKTERLMRALRNRDTQGILKNLHNDFEPFVFKKFPKIFGLKQRIAEEIKRSRRGGCALTGSGGALFSAAASVQCARNHRRDAP